MIAFPVEAAAAVSLDASDSTFASAFLRGCDAGNAPDGAAVDSAGNGAAPRPPSREPSALQSACRRLQCERPR